MKSFVVRVVGSFCVALALTGCREMPLSPTDAAAQRAASSRNGSDDDNGNEAKHGTINVRALLDGAGTAVLEVRTGTFNSQTNVATPDGYFQSIQYKIYDTDGKLRLVKNVHFSAPGVVSYVTVVDLCSDSDEDLGNGPHAGARANEDGAQPPCTTKVGDGWKAVVLANLKGVAGDPNKTDVVRAEAIFALDDTPPPAGAVDIAVGALQRVGNGVDANTLMTLDTTAAGTVIKVRTVIYNATSTATNVDCTINADGTLGATPVGSVLNVAVSPIGTAICEFTLSPLALGVYPISISVTPSAGSPADPHVTNNIASGTLRVLTGGRFSALDLNGMDVKQEWFNAIGATAFPADSLTLQNVRASQLALIVVPTQDVIGTFTLKGTVISGSVTYPTGVVSGTLRKSDADVSCGITVGPNAKFSNVSPEMQSVGYYGAVCSEPTTVNGVPGFQKISIDYVQSLASSIMRPGQLVLGAEVQVKIELTFKLSGATESETVTATVNLALPEPILRGLTNLDETRVMWSQQNATAAVVTTP
jgi:hypothetical protein